jgi:hypothetical protein
MKALGGRELSNACPSKSVLEPLAVKPSLKIVLGARISPRNVNSAVSLSAVADATFVGRNSLPSNIRDVSKTAPVISGGAILSSEPAWTISLRTPATVRRNVIGFRTSPRAFTVGPMSMGVVIQFQTDANIP